MIIYLKDKNSHEIKEMFQNCKSFTENSVTFIKFGCEGKSYCDTSSEYFTDKFEQ
jgi:hypothetical protein